MTGGRLKRVADYITDEELFCFTYGDGVSDVDIRAAIDFHRQHGKLATVTAVQPPGRYGALERDGDQVDGFIEKPRGDGGLINGGFFVLSPRCLDSSKATTAAGKARRIVRPCRQGQMMAFEHRGFWQPMDTLRDKTMLEELGPPARRPGRYGSDGGSRRWSSGAASASCSPATPASRAHG